MGAVYLARQVSLDRPVALKVMNPEWAQDPAFLARFTREAYAAAQLVHQNIVQVYDIGCDRGLHYFSMEYVEGQSLGELRKARGKLPAEEAAGYVLQAARGLKFAHERGIIHRDVKPDNLLLNNQGLIKVADLGLVRTPGMEEAAAPLVAPAPAPPASLPSTGGQSLPSPSEVTQAGQGVGTAGYIAPEQARDARKADARSDVYGLGCTLYLLVTGQPVFKGSNAVEIITKHVFEPIVRPDAIVKTLPQRLADIIVKMLAKKPEERYSSMGQVIRVLEDFLKVEAGRVAEQEQHLRTLERAVKDFHSAGPAALRTPVLLGFFGGCGALVFLFLLLGAWKVAGSILGLGLLTALAHLAVHGVTQRTYLFQKVRDVFLSAGWRPYARMGVGLLLLGVFLWVVGLLWVWLLAALLGVGLAIGFHYAVESPIAAGQAEALDRVGRMLKSLRLRGQSEEALQELVCKNAGEHWEEFFEALFGYEAKLAARLSFAGGPAAARPRFAAWRDPLLRWLDRYQKARHEVRARQHIEALERANREAQGLPAEATPPAAVPVPAEAAQALPAAPVAQVAAPAALPLEVRVITDPSRSADSEGRPRRRIQIVPALLEFLLGARVRLLLGALLLGISLYWLYDRELLPGQNPLEGWSLPQVWEEAPKAAPLEVPGVPPLVAQALCSLGAVIAGVVLILSTLWENGRTGLMTLLAAAVIVAGPVSGRVPVVEGTTPLVLCLAAGGVLVLVGLLLGRER
jgi:hypothetical protein